MILCTDVDYNAAGVTLENWSDDHVVPKAKAS